MASEPGAGARADQGRLHLRQSVRVRITLAAVVVTAAAVGLAGWLLVRTVEDSQLNEVRGDINSELDLISAGLEEGKDPDEVAQCALLPIQVTNAEGEVLVEGGAAVAPSGQTVVLSGQGGDVRQDLQHPEECGHEAPPSRGPDPAVAPPPEGEGQIESGLETTCDPPPANREEPPTQSDVADDDESECRDQPPPEGGDEPPNQAWNAFSPREIGYTGEFETLTREVETPDGTLHVAAVAPVEQVARSLDALRGALMVGLPAVVLLVAWVAWLLVGRALRPVEAIRAEVDEISGTTIHRRVPEPATGDEIGRLARTMNAMLGRLDRSATRQRQFVSDASHELRSPVAAIRTTVEVARHKGDRADWPAVADTVLAEEARLEGLLDDLLLLAADDENGTNGRKAAPVDLTAVVRAEAERPRQVPVEVTLPADDDVTLPVVGHAGQLARVIINLLDNAARHTTSTVTVVLTRASDTASPTAGTAGAAGAVRLTVDDDGPGIPVTDRQRVFERFTRLDDGRARNQGGSGLGLAVVQSIVRRHHGRVWVDDSPLGGARLVVDFPSSS